MSNTKKGMKVLIAEDGEHAAEATESRLQQAGIDFEGITVKRKEEVIQALREYVPDIILSRFDLGGFTGLDVIDLRNRLAPHIPLIILGRSANKEAIIDCMKRGAEDCLTDTSARHLREAVEEALRPPEANRLQGEMEKKLLFATEQWRNIFDSILDGVVLLDTECTVMRCNRAFRDLAGKKWEEIIGASCCELLFCENSQSDECPAKKSLSLHESRKQEMMINGRHYIIHANPVDNEEEDTAGVVMITEDVSEVIHQQKRQTLHARILDILNRSNDWDNIIRDLLSEIKRYTMFDVVGIRLKDNEEFPYFESIGLSDNFLKNERPLCVRNYSGEILRDGKGQPYLECLCGTVLQGTTNSDLPFFTEYGSFWTTRYSEFLETTPKEQLPNTIRTLCRNEGYESMALVPLKKGEEIVGLLQLNDRNGNRLTEEMVRFFEEIGNSIGIAFVRQQNEVALQESEERFRTISENSPDAIFLTDEEGNFRYVNPATFDLLGYSSGELLGKNILDLHRQEDKEEVREKFERTRKKGNEFSEIHLLRRDGQLVEAELNAVILPDGMVYGACRDLTRRNELEKERQQLEQQLRRSQMIESIGTLASGVAHDINNTLAPITLYTDALLEGEEALSKKARRFLSTIKNAVQDVEKTIDRLRLFYKQDEMDEEELQTIDLSTLISQVVDMSRPRWRDIPQKNGANIRIDINIPRGLGPLFGNETEIREALVNLVFNAVDAMPDGGVIHIRAMEEDRSMVLEVEDTGAGMSEEAKEKCLEPFFSTKGEKGTGLGLPMVFGMLQRHRGTIEIESSPGTGTKIRCIFPKREKKEVIQEVENIPSPPESLRILFIDDDVQVIEALRQVLETDSHSVVSAMSGEEGVRLFRNSLNSGETFDLVITDLGMPEMDGQETARKIKEANPRTPLILLTGWEKFLDGETGVSGDVDVVLGKPPRISKLRQEINRLIKEHERD